MIIPDKVKIFNYDYDVKVVEEPIIHQGQVCLGLCDGLEQEILLSANLNQQTLETTLLHEILHTAQFHYNMDMGDKTEEIIDNFAHLVHGLIKDNPLMFITEDGLEQYFNLIENENIECEETCEHKCECVQENMK